MRASTEACRRYLERLPFLSARRGQLLQSAEGADAPSAMAQVHGAIHWIPPQPRMNIVWKPPSARTMRRRRCTRSLATARAAFG
jgi:hypothetical protein